MAGFRDYQVAAPLKPVECADLHARPPRFRDYQVAAPLKPPGNVIPKLFRHRFPRLSSRGPIEANTRTLLQLRTASFRDYQVAAPLKRRMSLSLPVGSYWFPRLSSRGPIEAIRSASSTLAVGGFPRLSSRGPIEAQFLPATTRLRRARFRDYQVAAPLKPANIARNTSHSPGFRDYQVAAPLKPPLGS